jgi:hypothetical protein
MRKPTAKTFKQWMTANLTRGEMRDLVENGADSGWPGLTYTRDTVVLYDKYEEEIWERLNALADDLGEHPMKMVAGFGRADMATSGDGFKNLLVWFMAEETAREIVERKEARS